ncbi:MAG TPA: hypothetical protein VN702_17810 [Acetobacteraceae bacterium]|nr:hypothetical protein [Acetobacteraceae bacterium]
MTREFRLMLAEQGAADPELMGAGVTAPKSAAEGMRDAAAQTCEGLPARSYPANFAGCNPANVAGYCANAIRAIPIPADPRDAEIAALRAALTDIENATRAASGYLDVNRATVWRVNDLARAALAQSGEAG